MIAKQIRIEIQRLMGGLVADGVFGAKTEAQIDRLKNTPAGEEWFPVAPVAPPVPTVPEIPVVTDRVDDRSEKAISTLHRDVQPLARSLVNAAKAEGITIKVTSGTRTYAEQDALFKQASDGRDNDGDGRVDESDERVTKARAGHSNHNFGLALDVTIFDGSNPVWESPKYKRVGELGKSIGLEWGGDWKSFKDEPHFEFVPDYAKGLSSSQRLAEYRKRHDAGTDMVA